MAAQQGKTDSLPSNEMTSTRRQDTTTPTVVNNANNNEQMSLIIDENRLLKSQLATLHAELDNLRQQQNQVNQEEVRRGRPRQKEEERRGKMEPRRSRSSPPPMEQNVIQGTNNSAVMMIRADSLRHVKPTPFQKINRHPSDLPSSPGRTDVAENDNNHFDESGITSTTIATPTAVDAAKLEMHDSGRGLKHRKLHHQHSPIAQKSRSQKSLSLSPVLRFDQNHRIHTTPRDDDDGYYSNKLQHLDFSNNNDDDDDDLEMSRLLLVKTDDRTTPRTAAETPPPRTLELDDSIESDFLHPNHNNMNRFWATVWDRAGWLVGLLVLQSMSSFIISRNERLLQSHLVIVRFLTMLVGAGGNAGNQASVGVIRGLATGTVNDRNVKDTLYHELLMGLALSFVLGVAGAVRAAVFMTPLTETLAITTSLVAIVFISVLLGAVLPLIMKSLRIDPAHSSTTIQVLMDILGVTITVYVSGTILDSAFNTWVSGLFGRN